MILLPISTCYIKYCLDYNFILTNLFIISLRMTGVTDVVSQLGGLADWRIGRGADSRNMERPWTAAKTGEPEPDWTKLSVQFCRFWFSASVLDWTSATLAWIRKKNWEVSMDTWLREWWAPVFWFPQISPQSMSRRGNIGWYIVAGVVYEAGGRPEILQGGHRLKWTHLSVGGVPAGTAQRLYAPSNIFWHLQIYL